MERGDYKSLFRTGVIILLPATSSVGCFTKRIRGRLELTPRKECQSVRLAADSHARPRPEAIRTGASHR
jgi:hypothetical protein